MREPIWGSPPDSPVVTDYDQRHLAVYLRLLDAAAADADWREVCAVVLAIDAQADPARARQAHDVHLARAHWLIAHGYRHLLESSTRG